MVDPVPELNHTAVVQLPARLAGHEAVALKENCQQMLQGSSIPKKIIFDFSQTKFIDSSGIGALVSNHKTTCGKNVEMVLKGVLPPVMAVLEMTALDKVLNIEPQEDLNLPDPNGSNKPRTTNQSSRPSWLKILDLNSENQISTHPSVRSRVKRLLDIVGAIVGLGITSVAIIPIAIAIKLSSPGPILFGQTRLGWMGRRFTIWKFRSMYTDAEARLQELIAENQQSDAKTFKMVNDPRITPVGKFLRKSSLDELPQFWNVLKGEMSLVGTRPPTPNEVDIYEVPEWQRLDVKPGMTGEWQVNGRSSIRNFEDIIKLDLRYQQNWSLAYDLKLIIKTIVVVFHKDSGAV